MIEREHASIQARLINGYSADSSQYLDRLELGSTVERCIAARFCIQKAREHAGTHTGENWLDRGEAGLIRVISLDVKSHIGYGSESARAAHEIANMPIYKELVSGAYIPTQDALAEAYCRTLEAGETITDRIKHFKELDKKFNSGVYVNHAQKLTGIQSEVAVAALLHRYALYEIGDGTWFALPSTLENDHHVNDDVLSDGNWDIDVYAQIEPEQSAQLSYKVQVKTRGVANHPKPDEEDQDDVVWVRVSPDLSIDQESNTLGATIIKECAGEYRQGGNDYYYSRIQQRTNNLLDILA